jgi:TonB family protein
MRAERLEDETAEAGTDGVRLGDSLRQRAGRSPGKAPVAGSIAIHLLVLASFFLAGITEAKIPMEFQTVEINLVSPPPTVKGEPEPVETTAPVVTTPTPPPEPAPRPVDKPKPATQAATPKPVVSKPSRPKPAQGDRPQPVAVGGEDLNIRQEGVPFPYPDYLAKIVTQLPRYLRPPPGVRNLTAEVVFSIRRDGSVGDIELSRSSGNIDFDEKAVDAVENAGRAKFAGPLPEGYQNDKLFIRYTFVPKN